MTSAAKGKTMKLSPTDYKNVLKFYKIDPAGMSAKEIKAKAEHYLVMKLCKCIKNIAGPKTVKNIYAKKEKRAIAICYNSVLKKKNLKVFKFNCKQTVKLSKKPGTRTIYVEKLK